MGGVPWAPGRSGSEKQSELEQTGDRPPLLPRFSVVCHGTYPGLSDGAARAGGSDATSLATGIWTIEKAQDEPSQPRVYSKDVIPESRISPKLTPAYFLSLFRLRRLNLMVPGWVVQGWSL